MHSPGTSVTLDLTYTRPTNMAGLNWKPASIKDPTCLRTWFTLNLMWVKRPPAVGMEKCLERQMTVQVASSSSYCGSKLRVPSQNSPRIASKQNVNISKRKK
ncbi:hypothetical protein AVEN_35870-1 [Araneus ventricosus]|uniref:Uncharacterized protein n=1 Tax=Araneus ventricosus TaxID=182803 RepID=A0A4Y2BJA1_ARAVE|nr:hypothetical protein AVEN_35870-1 [Araneus ventricosus]